MKKILTALVLIAIVLGVPYAAYAQTLQRQERLLSMGEIICSQYKFFKSEAYRDCVRRQNEPYTLPDLKVHGLAVAAYRLDNSGFVTWYFTVQVENSGGTRGLQTGQMPVYTDISFGRVCPEHEYCPENYERLMEEHWITIPRPGDLINLSFTHKFYDPDGSGTIPKSFYILVDSRLGGRDCVPGVVIESDEYNNVGYIELTYVENGNNYWTRVY